MLGTLVLASLGAVVVRGNTLTFEHSAMGPFFSIPLTIGEPKTEMNVGIDGYYGSSLVYGKGAECDGSDKYCVQHKVYDIAKSMSFKKKHDHHPFDFSLGTAEGPAGVDNLAIGPLMLKGAMLGVADSISRPLNRKAMTSGFMAMNAPEMKDSDKTTMQLFLDKAARPLITFHAPMDMNGEHTITIGKEDMKNCKNDWTDIDNVKSIDPHHSPWTIQMNGLSWGKWSQKKMQTVAMNVAADYFVAPKAQSKHFWDTLGAKFDDHYAGGLVDCAHRDTAPPLVFKYGKKKKTKRFEIPAKLYIKMFDSDTCLLNIYPDELNQWTLPYMFHQRYCVRYDYAAKKVGIAEKK